MLRRLAFASRARIGLRAADTSEVIATCRANNARDGITGVLLYSGERFLEVIEGRDVVIESLLRRILADTRHQNIATLFDLTPQDRRFPRWRAGYLSERELGYEVERWRELSELGPREIERLLEFVKRAETF